MLDTICKDLFECITSYMPLFDIVILSRLNSHLRKRVLENATVRKQIKTEINGVLADIGILKTDRPECYLIHSGHMGDRMNLSKLKYDSHSVVYDNKKIIMQIDRIPNFRLKQVESNGKMLNAYKINLQRSDRADNMVYLMRLIQLKFGIDNFVNVPTLKVNPVRTRMMMMSNDTQITTSINDVIENPGCMDVIIEIRRHEHQGRELLIFDVGQLRTYGLCSLELDSFNL